MNEHGNTNPDPAREAGGSGSPEPVWPTKGYPIDSLVAGFVEGQEVTPDMQRAVDAFVVDTALITGLTDESAGVRERSVLLASEVEDLAPSLRAELENLAAKDPARRVRNAAVAALAKHEQPEGEE